MSNRGWSIFALILIVAIFSISAVGAASDLAMDNVSADDGQELFLEENLNENVSVSTDDDELNGGSDNDEILETDNNHFYKDLSNLINDGGDIVYIHKDYNYGGSYPAQDIGGFSITHSVTIYGNGHTIDAKASEDEHATFCWIGASNVTIYDLTFKNGKADSGYCISGSGTFINCHFKNNKGGVMSGCTAINCTFDGNDGFKGGAVDNGVAINCTFHNNYAWEGGAVSNSLAMGCEFKKNHARYDGGAMYNSIAINCEFCESHANDNGGAMYNCNATGCNFTENTASNGGAIYLGYAVNSTFNKNKADDDGGAIWECNALNCNFTENSAFQGGAIYSGVALNCNFTKNSVTGENCCGGALYDCNATGCIFTENAAIDVNNACGGAAYNCNVTNCTFIANRVSDDFEQGGQCYGGAIWGSNAVGCIFKNNWADDSGGAMNGGTASNCTFTDNKAGSIGGALCECNAMGCNFTNNYAQTLGGAMFGGSAINCSFTSDGSYRGGAIYQGNATGCIFSNNHAVVGGAMNGCIARDCIFNNNIAENTSLYPGEGCGGAMYNCSAATCIFKQNTAVEGGAIYYGTALLCCFEDNDCVKTTFVPANFIVDNFNSVFDSNERLLFNLTADGMNYNGFNTTISVYQNETLVGTYYALSSEGWIVNLDAGNYTAILSIDKYIGVNNATVSVNIVPYTTKIISEKVFATYGSDDVFIINLSYGDGKPLVGVDVAVDLNGVKSYTSDDSGRIKISVEGLAARSHVADICFVGNRNFLASNASATLTIFKETATIDANQITTIYNVNKNLVATVKDHNGNPLTGVGVSVVLNGMNVYTTDKNGQIRISLGDLLPKTYNVSILFDGNANYTGLAIAKVVVKKASLKLTAKKKTFKAKTKVKKYSITLKANGKPVKKVQVILKIKGKTYKAKTNKNGKATFKIKKLAKKGKYKVKVTFKGDARYKKVTKKVNIIIR